LLSMGWVKWPGDESTPITYNTLWFYDTILLGNRTCIYQFFLMFTLVQWFWTQVQIPSEWANHREAESEIGSIRAMKQRFRNSWG
jgi:hypothetical protein